jgi:hypothetical protein
VAVPAVVANLPEAQSDLASLLPFVIITGGGNFLNLSIGEPHAQPLDLGQSDARKRGAKKEIVSTGGTRPMTIAIVMVHVDPEKSVRRGLGAA